MEMGMGIQVVLLALVRWSGKWDLTRGVCCMVYDLRFTLYLSWSRWIAVGRAFSTQSCRAGREEICGKWGSITGETFPIDHGLLLI